MKAKKADRRQEVRWIMKMEIRHWRTGRMMRRKDGRPFKFPIFK